MIANPTTYKATTVYYTTTSGETHTIATIDLVEVYDAIFDELDAAEMKAPKREPRDPLPRPPRRITYEGRPRDRPHQRPSTYG